jgi:hypothetical protein
MASRHSSAPTTPIYFRSNLPIRVCGRRTPDEDRERKIMHAGTKRIVIGAAALAAAGLFGSLPFDGTQVAQQGVPTVHRDVTLVDDFTPLLTDEGTFDNALFNDVLGPTGAEEQLFNTLATALSGGTLDAAGTADATTLLDATGASPIFSGDFDGAESRLFEGLFLNTLVGEDELNQALGATPLESQTELLSVFNTDFVPIPSSADLTAADLTSALGSSTFDTDLTTIANADYTLAGGDFDGFLTNLATDTSGLTDVSTLLTDLSSSFSDLSTNLSGDLSTLLTALTGLL